AARDSTTLADAIGQARLQRKEADANEAHQHYGAALALLDHAETSLGPEPDVANQAWWHEWIEVQNGRFRVHYWTANREAMAAASTILSPVVERHGTPKQRVAHLQWLANENMRRERYVPSDETLAMARAAFAAASADDLGPQFVLGFTLLWRGDLAAAEEHLLASRAAAERMGDKGTIIRCTIYLATLCRFADGLQA